MKTMTKATTIYYIYIALQTALFIMMKTIRDIYRYEIAQLNEFQIVIVGTTLEISHLLFEVPTGILADKYSRKLSIIIGTLMIGISILIEGLFPIFIIIISIQIILGIGDTLQSGADEAWIIDELNNKNTTIILLKGTQIGQLFAIMGTIISIYFGQINLKIPYFISGTLFIGLAIFLIIFMKETNFSPNKNTDNNFKHMKKTIIKVFSLIKKSKILIFMLIITLFYGLYSEGIDRFWTLHFLEEVPLPTENPVLWIGTISLLAMILSITIVGLIRKRLNKTGKLDRVWMLFIINFLMVITLFLFAITKQFIITTSLYLIFYTIRKVNQPILRAFINEQLPSNIRASSLSTFGQLDSIGQIIGGPVIGLIANLYSISIGIIFSVFLLTPVIFIYLYFIRSLIKKKT